MSLLIREKVAQERGRRHSAALSLTPCRKKQSRYVTETDLNEAAAAADATR